MVHEVGGWVDGEWNTHTFFHFSVLTTQHIYVIHSLDGQPTLYVFFSQIHAVFLHTISHVVFPLPRYQLWILLSGINFPDLLTPYYERRPVSAFFFVVYLLLGYFFLARLVLAIAFKSYKQDCHTRLITRWHRSLDGMQVSHQPCQPCQPCQP